MVRRAPLKRHRLRAFQKPDQAPVQPETHEIGGDMRGLSRANIAKSGNDRRADGVVVPNHGRRTIERFGNPHELPTIEQLSMGKMYVREGNIAEPDDLREARWHAAGHP